MALPALYGLMEESLSPSVVAALLTLEKLLFACDSPSTLIFAIN
jgi:hypothetical protein